MLGDKRMVIIFKEIIMSIKKAPKILLFEILYKIITSLCLVPCLVALFNFSLKVTGYSFITTRNINNIIKNPFLILFFVLILLLFAMITLLEVFTLTLFFGYDFKEKGFHLRELFILIFKESKRLFKPSNIILVLYTICMIPIINFISITKYLTGYMQIQEYIYNNIIKSKMIVVFLTVIFIILFILCIQMIFVFCYFFLEHKNLNDSFESSKKLMKGKVMKTISYICFCNLFFIVLYILFYLIIILFVQLGAKFFYDQNVAYAAFLTIFNKTNKVFVLLLSALEIVSNFCLTVHLYFKYSGKRKKMYPIIFTRKGFTKKLPFRVKKVIAKIIVSTLILTSVGIYLIINNEYTLLNDEKTKITSHRGNSISAPENTIASIQYAINEMADYAEIDARETEDGVIVVFHDSNLKRITKINKKISDVTYEQIKNLDVGGWFSDEFIGERIPTLEEVIQYSKGKIKLNIELKTSKKDKYLEESIVNLIEENDFVDSCVITSFNYQSLRKIKKLNPNIRTGYILSAVYGNFYDLKDADFFSIQRNFVTERTVAEIHKRGKEVHVWTVNDKKHIGNLSRIGVDNIITDDPVLARTIIYSADFPEYTTNFLKLIFR